MHVQQHRSESMAFSFYSYILLLMSLHHCRGGSTLAPDNSILVPPIKYDAPDDCQWWIRDGSNGITPDEVALICKLRTINSEFDTTNFSVIPSEHTTSLRIECNEELMSKSSINDRSFAHLTKLRELTLANCKLARWSSDTLAGLANLRNLTVKTKNTDWPTMSLDVGKGSFEPAKLLERLDLSTNNIYNLPSGVFCPLSNLVFLNLSENRLQDVSDLGFREKAAPPPPPQPLVSGQEELGQPISRFDSLCSLNIQTLDVSYNHFVLLPTLGFSTLKRLKDLYLNNNEISMIAERSLHGLKQLQIFDLSSNRIVSLPVDMFRDCADSITEIYLQNNSINVLSPELFTNLNQLMSLDLSFNQLTSAWINKDTFSGLIRLVLLNLSHNSIARLDASMFHDLYTLQILNLQNNQIESIQPDTFAPMSNLHTLKLSSNKIKSIDVYAFNGLYVMSYLSLDYNMIERLHPDVFKNCTGLQDLYLSSNRLSVVPAALRDMHLLRTVDLGENAISEIDMIHFRGLSKLYGLRLIGNKIKKVTNRSLSSLPALQILNLARNKIDHVDQSAFAMNSNLQAVRLDDNLLKSIEGIFINVPSLQWLNVSDNQISYFDYNLLPPNLQWLDVHKNNISELHNRDHLENTLKIQIFDASFNKLVKVTPVSIPNSVELLFLNDNLIKTVEPHTFLKKLNLTRVDLYANQIAEMELNALALTPVEMRRSLPEFYIGGNPFQCNCKMEWLQRINKLDHLRQHPRVMDLDSVYCRLLYNRDKVFVPLLEAESTQFLCKYKTHCFAVCHCCDFDACDCEMTCPQNCTCYHDDSWSSNIVECSSAGYTSMPTKIPMDATEVYIDGNQFGELSSHSFIGRKSLKILYANHSNIVSINNHTFSGLKRLTVLHLESNFIKQLLGYELVHLESLRELYLQNNQISYIDNGTFLGLKLLEVLRLDGNSLVNFHVWQLTMNPYLVEITLANNRYSCECDYMNQFKAWLKTNTGKVIDYEKILCLADNKTATFSPPVMHYNKSTNCANFFGSHLLIEHHMMDDYIFLLLMTLMIFIFAVAVVCCLFAHRKSIKLWMYSRCGIRICYKTTHFEEFDKDKLYDAYINYSIKDDAFVTQALAPGLEQNPTRSYQVCLHYRDFNISSYVSDTIIEAVESSRRTIIVISKHFVETEWCRFEFKSALHEILKDKSHKIILIILGDVLQKDLDPDLRLYIKTNTCLQWGEKQFWQKLKYAMPEVRRNTSLKSVHSLSHHHQRSSVNVYASTGNFEPALPEPPPPVKLLPFLQHPNNLQAARSHRILAEQPLWA
ncbi:unnamed protein product [Bemisia tabaci]|uniref:TIR domain-containing protein n=1 Tax=Bemisia tabaci TaxID=7038 RepID=A0A9P0F1A6_BEMTA|nr:unnamed protein product [Bemisia tabaci]